MPDQTPVEATLEHLDHLSQSLDPTTTYPAGPAPLCIDFDDTNGVEWTIWEGDTPTRLTTEQALSSLVDDHGYTTPGAALLLASNLRVDRGHTPTPPVVLRGGPTLPNMSGQWAQEEAVPGVHVYTPYASAFPMARLDYRADGAWWLHTPNAGMIKSPVYCGQHDPEGFYLGAAQRVFWHAASGAYYMRHGVRPVHLIRGGEIIVLSYTLRWVERVEEGSTPGTVAVHLVEHGEIVEVPRNLEVRTATPREYLSRISPDLLAPQAGRADRNFTLRGDLLETHSAYDRRRHGL